MSDRIFIRDLRLRAIIGVDDVERERPKEILLNLELETDLTAAARSDALEDAVDYQALTEQVARHVQASRHRLLERLADSVAQLVLESFPAVDAVTVRADKPGALPSADSVAVQIRRTRPHRG